MFSATAMLTLAASLAGAPAPERAPDADRPGPWTDWVGRLNERLDQAEPAGEPAWPIYRRLIIDRLGIEGERPGGVWDPSAYFDRLETAVGTWGEDVSRGDWNGPRYDGLRDVLDESADVLDALHAAAGKPRMGKRYARVGDAINGEQDPTATGVRAAPTLMEYGPMGQFSSLTLAAARQAASEDDWPAFERHIVSAFAVGAHSARHGAWVELAGGARWMTRAARETRHTLNERDVPAAIASALDESLRFDAVTASRYAIETARMDALAELESFFTRGREFIEWRFLDSLDGRMEFDQNEEWVRPRAEDLPASRAPYPSFGETRAEIDRLYDGWLDTFDDASTWIERAEAHASLTTENTLLHRWTTDPPRPLIAAARLARDLRAARLMLRLERIHAETGAWPESLDAPELAELSEDPVTGEPFGYQRTPDDPHDRPYVLTAPETSLAWIEGGEMNPPRPALPDDPGG